MSELGPEAVLQDIVSNLRRLGRPFALVGGLAVSLRAEVRFTRDVDLAVAAPDDADMERLVYELRDAGYVAIAVVEHQERKRLSTVRLASPSGMVVDLLAASSGIEAEVVARATAVSFEEIGEIPVARAEELLAMKVLSMTERRLLGHHPVHEVHRTYAVADDDRSAIGRESAREERHTSRPCGDSLPGGEGPHLQGLIPRRGDGSRPPKPARTDGPACKLLFSLDIRQRYS
jgi:hypothetical protein